MLLPSFYVLVSTFNKLHNQIKIASFIPKIKSEIVFEFSQFIPACYNDISERALSPISDSDNFIHSCTNSNFNFA